MSRDSSLCAIGDGVPLTAVNLSAALANPGLRLRALARTFAGSLRAAGSSPTAMSMPLLPIERSKRAGPKTSVAKMYRVDLTKVLTRRLRASMTLRVRSVFFADR